MSDFKNEFLIENTKKKILQEYEKFDYAKNLFRKQASELMGIYYQIHCNKLLIRLNKIPNQEKILLASSKLIGLSNSIESTNFSNHEELRKEISNLLMINIITERFGN